MTTTTNNTVKKTGEDTSTNVGKTTTNKERSSSFGNGAPTTFATTQSNSGTISVAPSAGFVGR